MSITADQVLAAAARWGLEAEAAPAAAALAAYGNLLLAWNARLSLTAIRDEATVIERHLLEGLFAAAHHPPAESALDFGSGTGVPGIPIAISRPQLRVTLAESQQKKASFLREVIRTLGLSAQVHAARAEALSPASFESVWMRAVERSREILPSAAALVRPSGHLCLLTSRGGSIVASATLGSGWHWETVALPRSEERVLHIGHKM